MRLSGWQKLGIALSVLWAMASAIHMHRVDVDSAEGYSKLAYRVCSNSKMLAKDADLSQCEKEKAEHITTWMKDSNKNVALAALTPIPFGWLAGFILLYVCRIQVAGFRATVPWSRLSRPKKGFAIFSFAAAAAGLLFMAMAVMNLYVDTQVPVALSPFLDVVMTGDDLVHVSGTWTRQGSAEGSSMGEPLQTSTIECNRAENRCTEAKASLAGNVLTSEVVEHDVQSWTREAIVLKDTFPCAEEIYTIDLNTKAVTGAGHRINGDTPLCKLSPASLGETEWGYRLEKGFPVYWDLREKARPWPLRVIQALFGK